MFGDNWPFPHRADSPNTRPGNPGGPAPGIGRGADQFLIGEGPGHEVIDGFCPAIGDRLVFDRYDFQTDRDVLLRLQTSGQDALIRFEDGGSVRLTGVNPEDVDEENIACLGGPVCLVAGTSVVAEGGRRPVETLLEGDRVVTMDHGLRQILQISRQIRQFDGPDDPARPVVVSVGALGFGSPRRNLVVAPRLRLLIRHPRSGEEILIAASKLVGRAGISRVKGCASAHFINLRCDAHEVIRAEGALVETLLIHPRTRVRPALAGAVQLARRVFLKDPLVHPDRIDPISRD